MDNFEKHERAMTYYGRVSQTFGPVLNELKNQIQTGKILDNGTSIGRTANELLQIFGEKIEIVGLDINPNRIEKARKTQGVTDKKIGNPPPQTISAEGKISWAIGDGYFPNLLFEENSFEAVFMMNNLYQVVEDGKISQDQLKIILQNQFSIIKPNGFLCLSGVSDNDNYSFLVIRLDENKKPEVFAQNLASNLEFHNFAIFHNIIAAFASDFS